MSVDVGNPQTVDDFPDVKVYDFDFRGELLELHHAITELGLWDAMKQPPAAGTGFIFSDQPHHDTLRKHKAMQRHSGATAGYALKIMYIIATKGFDAYKREHMAAVKNSK
jgi:hypothetical protein